MTVQNPHDRFFRESFGRVEVARSFLQEYLPPELLAALNLEHLTLHDGSFIDERMRAHQSDLLYEAHLSNGLPVLIYFLFEHKSRPDRRVMLQLLRYMLRMWERQVKARMSLSPVIPVVIHHGKQEWTAPQDFHSLFVNLPEGVRPYLPDFQYHLADFSYVSDEEIRGNIWLRVSAAVMRAIFDPGLRDKLDDLLALIFQLSQRETGLEYIHTVLYYLSMATEYVHRQDLEEALLRQEKKGDEIMATIAQEYIQEGFEKGLESGMARGMARGMERGMLAARKEIARQLLELHSAKTVSEITGLPLAEVEALQAEE
ncbi:MAG TPA: Rpn family recombination-promoting nuclease/putative transposase [Anaerolineae bacterium]|nr:Rpn family recombination-promoting nuclease/putative transposase [Anaerolineae bacterium]